MSTTDELREYVRLAAQILGKERLSRRIAIGPPPQRQEEGTYPTEYVTHLCWVAAEAYGIALPSVAVSFIMSETAAGYIEREGGIFFIEVDPRFVTDHERLLAIAAHEVAHIAIAAKKVRLTPLQREEELTDAVAALGGFGDVLINAKHRETTHGLYPRVTHTSTVGYLSVDALRTLLNWKARLEPGRFGVRRRPWTVAKEPLWNCDVCHARMKLPEISATIVVSCATCGRRFKLTLVSGVIPTDLRTVLKTIGAFIADAFSSGDEWLPPSEKSG